MVDAIWIAMWRAAEQNDCRYVDTATTGHHVLDMSRVGDHPHKGWTLAARAPMSLKSRAQRKNLFPGWLLLF